MSIESHFFLLEAFLTCDRAKVNSLLRAGLDPNCLFDLAYNGTLYSVPLLYLACLGSRYIGINKINCSVFFHINPNENLPNWFEREEVIRHLLTDNRTKPDLCFKIGDYLSNSTLYYLRCTPAIASNPQMELENEINILLGFPSVNNITIPSHERFVEDDEDESALWEESVSDESLERGDSGVMQELTDFTTMRVSLDNISDESPETSSDNLASRAFSSLALFQFPQHLSSHTPASPDIVDSQRRSSSYGRLI
jgi:hypothetical protein